MLSTSRTFLVAAIALLCITAASANVIASNEQQGDRRGLQETHVVVIDRATDDLQETPANVLDEANVIGGVETTVSTTVTITPGSFVQPSITVDPGPIVISGGKPSPSPKKSGRHIVPAPSPSPAPLDVGDGPPPKTHGVFDTNGRRLLQENATDPTVGCCITPGPCFYPCDCCTPPAIDATLRLLAGAKGYDESSIAQEWHATSLREPAKSDSKLGNRRLLADVPTQSKEPAVGCCPFGYCNPMCACCTMDAVEGTVRALGLGELQDASQLFEQQP